MKAGSAIGGALGGIAAAGVLWGAGATGLAYAVLLAALLLLSFGSGWSLALQIGLATVFGALLGSLPGSGIDSIAPVGSLFIAALKMLIAPMIFLSIVSGITGMGRASELGRIGALTLVLYLGTMALAVVVGLAMVNLFQPGAGGTLLDSPFFRETLAGAPAKRPPPLSEFLTGTARLVLTNPLRALAEGRILPIVFFAVLFGVALLQLGERARPLTAPLQVANDAVMQVIGWFIRLAPIGVFALVGQLVAQVPFAMLFAHLAGFIGVVFAATLIHAGITLPLVAYAVANLRPGELFRGIREALGVAFTTSSSAATLPVTTRCVEENLDVPRSVSSFVLPLGASVNMDGTALYEAIAALFIANLYGIELGFGAQIVVFAMSMLMAVGAPGIPSAGMVTMVVVLEAVGLPAEAVAILLSVDRLLDTVRTMANVEGDAVVAVCVARRSA